MESKYQAIKDDEEEEEEAKGQAEIELISSTSPLTNEKASHNLNKKQQLLEIHHQQKGWTVIGYVLLITSYLLLGTLGTVLYLNQVSSTARVIALEGELAALRQLSIDQVRTMSGDITQVSIDSGSQFTSLNARLLSQTDSIVQLDGIVQRLSNRTTNADVLEQLQITSSKVSQDLASTTLNVTLQLAANEQHMRQAQTTVRQQLDDAMMSMKDAVLRATSRIYEVQSNVTNQLALMSRTLEVTVSNINEAVDAAEDTIHKEVQVVQENIEQYVAVTNKQFAAEDDFVKYQLAGTFTLLGCLISMWHLTSHLRHFDTPDVQRRVMAVLWMVPIYRFKLVQ